MQHRTTSAETVAWRLVAVAAALAAFSAWCWGVGPTASADPPKNSPVLDNRGAAPGSTPTVPTPIVAAHPALAGSSGNFNIISDVAESAVQSVVNISTTKLQRRMVTAEEQMFRRFWGLRGGDREEQRASSLGSGA